MTRSRWAVLVLAATLALPACRRQAAAPPGRGRGPLRFPVEVHAVEARAVEYAVAAVGSLDAFERVQITARVAGAVERVRFAEGDTVRAGQTLVEIEPRRYRLAVEAARASLSRAEAAQADAEAGARRREAAVTGRPGLLPAEELETWRTRARTAAAEVAQARVAVARAELDLHEAYVRAPAAGVVETRTVQTGQYAQPGTVLATIVRRDPLLLRFQVPEDDARRLRAGMAARFRLRDDSTEHSAEITHVAGQAAEATRMVAVVGRVAGGTGLRPGAFAEVRIPVGARAGAPVVPQTAIRPSERGFLAYVVEGGAARERVLELGLRTTDGLVEVRSGVRVGETLVVRGAEALRDGAAVIVGGPSSGPGSRGRGPAGPPGHAPAGGGPT